MSYRSGLMVGTAALSMLAFNARAEVTADEPTVTVIEEVLVTAEKRSQNLQEVPVAVSAYTSENRDLIGIRTIQDMANFTPGLSYSTSLDRISLRGVGRLTNVIGSDPGVATYNDGFYTSSTVEASKSPMFVERVEVLRGPQGTLYGRNSVGGAINVVSKRPTKDLHGEIRATAGNYDYRILEGWVSGPITDHLRYRLSGQIVKQDKGYFENTAGGPSEGGRVDRTLIELQLEGEIGDNFDYWLKASTAEWDDRGRSTTIIDPYVSAPTSTIGGVIFGSNLVPPNSIVANAAFGGTTVNPGVTDHRKFSADTPAVQTLDDNLNVVGEAVYHFESMDLKYVGGHSTYLYANYSDLDGTARDSFTYGSTSCPPAFCGTATIRPTYVQEYIEDKTYYSHELNLSSKTDSNLQWIAGLYQFHEEYFQPITWYAPNQAQLAAPRIALPPFTALAAANPRRAFYTGTGTLKSDSTALFGQIDYKIDDQWHLTFGLRYSKDEKDGVETYRLFNYDPTAFAAFNNALDITTAVTGAVPSGGVGTGPLVRKMSGSWDAVTGRFEMGWQPDADTLAYFSYSRGFKSGGFNLGSYSPHPAVDPEKVDSFELGLKKDFSPTLRINGALFYYNYENPQVPLPTFSGGVVTTSFINIAKSRSFGAELEATWLPIDALQLTLSYAYLDATIRKGGGLYVDESDPLAHDTGANPVGPTVVSSTGFVRQPQDLAGNRMPSSPRNKLAVNALYTLHFTPGALSLSGSYVWRDEAYYSLFQTDRFRAPSSEQFDARATWRGANDRYTVIVYGQNLTDREGSDGVSAGSGTGANGYGRVMSFTPPRTYGVELQYRF
jgi:iron complex outermembrane receptor protein